MLALPPQSIKKSSAQKTLSNKYRKTLPIKEQKPPETTHPEVNHKGIFEEATHLANTGSLNEAAALCTQLITLDPENTSYYCLHAWIYMELGQLEDAELALRRALFLNPDDIQARFQKGLYMIKNNDYEKSKKYLSTILDEVSTMPSDEPVVGWSEMSYGDLIKLIQSELEVISNY